MRRLWPLLLCLVGCDCQPPKPTEDGGVDAGTDAGEQGALTFTLEDFGEVLRGDSVERTGTFRNTGGTAAEVSAISVTGDAFSLVGAGSASVPANGESTVQVRFAPSGLGPQLGTLTWNSTTITLNAVGVGPALELEPASLDLGTLPLYDGAPATISAALTARNVGLDSFPHRPDTALQLLFDVQSTSSAPPGELCVGDCSGSAINLDVDAFNAVPITLTSTTPGVKTWDVRVLSNDPTRPMLTVPVTAEVIARPTCQFAVPTSLAFGVLTSPETRELEVILENVGTEVCEVSRVELGAEPLFSLVNAPLGIQTVAPGELLRVTVRAAPQDVAPMTPLAVSSELRFELNHPAGFARVALTAQLELSCLTVTPSPVDFGTVQTGCRSADRTVLLRNVCTRSLTVTSATLPSFSSFALTATLPVTLTRFGSVSLTTRFSPFAPGPARDVIDVAWLDGTTMKHTTIALRGEANATGENVDVFAAQTNKVDLLLVLDDSASMMPFVSQLTAQLPQVLAALQLRNVDFHLGVLDGSYQPPMGTLRRMSNGERWLTSTTPALSMRFTELTRWTGTQDAESCEEPVLKALTAPNVNDPLINGGFLRPDATLSVLCVSDRTDTNLRVAELLQAAASRRFIWNDLGPLAPSTPQCSVNYFQRAGQPAREATGGQLFDICASNWSPLFADLTVEVADQRKFFPLRARPDLLGTPPLSVSIGGVTAPPATDAGVPVWSWESPPNAVVFNPLYAPATTDLVSISYPVACMP